MVAHSTRKVNCFVCRFLRAANGRWCFGYPQLTVHCLIVCWLITCSSVFQSCFVNSKLNLLLAESLSLTCLLIRSHGFFWWYPNCSILFRFQTTSFRCFFCPSSMMVPIVSPVSLDWLKGKSSGNHRCYHQTWGFSWTFSLKPGVIFHFRGETS